MWWNKWGRRAKNPFYTLLSGLKFYTAQQQNLQQQSRSHKQRLVCLHFWEDFLSVWLNITLPCEHTVSHTAENTKWDCTVLLYCFGKSENRLLLIIWSVLCSSHTWVGLGIWFISFFLFFFGSTWPVHIYTLRLSLCDEARSRKAVKSSYTVSNLHCNVRFGHNKQARSHQWTRQPSPFRRDSCMNIILCLKCWVLWSIQTRKKVVRRDHGHI